MLFERGNVVVSSLNVHVETGCLKKKSLSVGSKVNLKWKTLGVFCVFLSKWSDHNKERRCLNWAQLQLRGRQLLRGLKERRGLCCNYSSVWRWQLLLARLLQAHLSCGTIDGHLLTTHQLKRFHLSLSSFAFYFLSLSCFAPFVAFSSRLFTCSRLIIGPYGTFLFFLGKRLLLLFFSPVSTWK